MKKTLLWLRVALALCLFLPASCSTPRQAAVDEVHPRAPKTVRVRELPGDALRLVFEPVASEPAWEQLRVEEARAVLAAFHVAFPREQGSDFRLVRALAQTGGVGAGGPAEWEQRLREEFVARYGPSAVPLPQSLETSPVFLALKLSPRYMGAGVRDAARELFSSPVFLSSVALSVFIYFTAWLAPEPVFTKAFVAAWTLRLSLLVGAMELGQFARVCVRLYQEAQAARTVEELEAAAEHFGRAVGGTGLRVLMYVASMGVARVLPQVPEGGLGTLLRAPRYALPGGMSMEGATAVRMVADGSIVVTGVAAGTAAATVGSACADGSESKKGYQWHHLATNKNDISERYGGPWTPLFKELFDRAGMNLDAAENLVYLKGHKGPHPEEYHEEVHQRLQRALGQCRTTAECRSRLADALEELVDEVCTEGSQLHRLLTKSRD